MISASNNKLTGVSLEKTNLRIPLIFFFIGILLLRIAESFTPTPQYGYVFYRMGLSSHRVDKALKYFLKAIRFNPDLPEAYNQLGLIHRDKKKEYAKSIEYFQKTIQLDKKFHEAYDNLGVAYTLQGDYGRAIPYFRRALEIYPYIHEYSYRLGLAYLAKGDKPHASSEVANLKAFGEEQMARELKGLIDKNP